MLWKDSESEHSRWIGGPPNVHEVKRTVRRKDFLVAARPGRQQDDEDRNSNGGERATMRTGELCGVTWRGCWSHERGHTTCTGGSKAVLQIS
jgi:hypothetical protein